jgi:hypothetical protein
MPVVRSAGPPCRCSMCTYRRELILTRYIEPEPELTLLLQKLALGLPAQPPPKINARPFSATSL